MPNGVPMSWLRTSYDHLPLFVAEGSGGRFRDVDGHEYADFNIADMSMFTGYAPAPVVEAVSRRVAEGAQFLLPTEDSIWVAEELGPSLRPASLAVHARGVERQHRGDPDRPHGDGPRQVLFFDGKYHGHFDEALVELQARRSGPGGGGAAGPR